MKLRIRGSSVRFRLGQSEVCRFAEEGELDESIQFDELGSVRLVYGLKAVSVDSSVSASFESGKIVVRIPADIIRRWASTKQVGIEAFQAIGESGRLKILIEKDFECIDGPPGEPQDDAYPHPGNRLACVSDEDQGYRNTS